METRISSKGQITIPSEIRRQLKIHTGDALLVKSVGENTIMLELKKKALPGSQETGEDILKATAGLWKDRTDINENFIRELRQADHRRLEELLGE
ncbi:AbrB/MazE/SpoVT family DNA-binding domain-containing protein [Neomoorella mulderi]|uniref:SpoVT / AbrB like domain protein n=1 Tax=Moorella mulderi DSM 14980 TaxID=1122241 RepID=A0A151AUX9_9FIRM|nr:AbrB/MazE/SpoVT family DNA-binding domain-containing protein [Moorella mulderi]KYH31207.1 SpoVT / AbrB like domain protein [Moorella mulderi DSM 14980]